MRSFKTDTKTIALEMNDKLLIIRADLIVATARKLARRQELSKKIIIRHAANLLKKIGTEGMSIIAGKYKNYLLEANHLVELLFPEFGIITKEEKLCCSSV